MTAPPTTTRRIEPDGDSWNWFLPISGTPSRDHPPVSFPAQEIEGPVTFLPASPPEDGYEIYRSVRGDLTVADALRVPVALPEAAERELPRLIHLAVTGFSSTNAIDPDPSLWEMVHGFLEKSARLGITEALRVRALLGDTPPDPAFLRYSSQGTLGLGRIVLGKRSDTTEPCFDRATVLVPAAPAPTVLNLSRTLAESLLTARLFATAGKTSAPSLSRVATSYSTLVARHEPTSAATLRTGAAALVVDHARRLAHIKGIDPPTIALELSVAAALLGHAAPDTSHV